MSDDRTTPPQGHNPFPAVLDEFVATGTMPHHLANYLHSLGPQATPPVTGLAAELLKNLDSLDDDDPRTRIIGSHLKIFTLLTTVHLRRTYHARALLTNTQRHHLVLIALNTIAKTTTLLAELFAIRAVKQKALTRRNAALLLDVHENTVARWAKGDQVYAQKLMQLNKHFQHQVTTLANIQGTDFDPHDHLQQLYIVHKHTNELLLEYERYQ